MRQLLFNLYNFHEDWAYQHVAPYIKPNMTVTILPFSFAANQITADNWQQFYGEQGHYYDDLTAPFKAFGIPNSAISLVNYFTADSLRLSQQLLNSDIIFLTGGLPDKTMDRLKKLALKETLEQFSGLLIGSSAGAMIQLKNYHITPDADYDSFTYQEGLDLITEFAIEVHFENSAVQQASIQRVLTETKIPLLYAIEDQGGLIVDQKVTAIGSVQLFQR